ncbi:peroxynitrite isomerase THAP4-like isoform X2 [Stegodyphus dumicola]|uniref:peroxynitrite isomerase THAP4-like isoform X2 n=1 Tax=Stegodyphus dumicola TaxID=202533 RepID=UPI0015ABFB7C|nr:peroxynitrite isomerase THAP4-like isoform X2 [Stegodyphus dumicola]
MGGCAAPNCSNQSKNNFRMFRFPRNEERRRKWIVNSRRDQWIPGPGAYLCEVHFEENQFECSRQDGRKKLKPNAVPTLFNVPNPPQLLTPQRLKGIGLPKHRSVTSNFCNGGLLHSLPLSTEAISVAEPSVVCLQEQASTSSCDKMPSICEGSHVCLQEQPLASFCNEIPSICEGSDDVLLRNFIKQQTELISLLQCQNKYY